MSHLNPRAVFWLTAHAVDMRYEVVNNGREGVPVLQFVKPLQLSMMRLLATRFALSWRENGPRPKWYTRSPSQPVGAPATLIDNPSAAAAAAAVRGSRANSLDLAAASSRPTTVSVSGATKSAHDGRATTTTTATGTGMMVVATQFDTRAAPAPPMTSKPAGPGLHLLVAEDNVLNHTVFDVLLRDTPHTYWWVLDGRACVEAYIAAINSEREKSGLAPLKSTLLPSNSSSGNSNNAEARAKARNPHESLSAPDQAQITPCRRFGPFDALLLDYYMPEMCGDAAAVEIRRFEHTHALAPIPIIGLTASDAKLTELCMRAGMNTVLTKPLHAPQLLALLGSLLNKPAPASAPPVQQRPLRLLSQRVQLPPMTAAPTAAVSSATGKAEPISESKTASSTATTSFPLPTGFPLPAGSSTLPPAL